MESGITLENIPMAFKVLVAWPIVAGISIAFYMLAHTLVLGTKTNLRRTLQIHFRRISGIKPTPAEKMLENVLIVVGVIIAVSYLAITLAMEEGLSNLPFWLLSIYGGIIILFGLFVKKYAVKARNFHTGKQV